MRRKVLLALALLILTASAAKADPWTRTDTAFQLAWTAIHVLDWGTTLDAARHPNEYWEMNPVIGRHPSVGRVNTYMAISTIANFAVARALPQPYRRVFQVISIGSSGALVANNFQIGLHVRF